MQIPSGDARLFTVGFEDVIESLFFFLPLPRVDSLKLTIQEYTSHTLRMIFWVKLVLKQQVDTPC